MSDDRLRLLLNEIPVPAMIARRDGTVLFVNKAWADQLGWALEEMVGQKYLDFVHPDDVHETVLEHEKLIDRGSEGFVNRYRTKAGEHVTVRWSSVEWGPNDTTYAFAEVDHGAGIC